MGGRGASSSSRQRVMTEEEYLSSKGYPFMGYSEAGLHMSNNRISEKMRSRDVKRIQENARVYDTKRAELRKEYNNLIKQGKIRKPTAYEQALQISKGDPSRSDVQAAKRFVEKYRQLRKNRKEK